MDVRAKNVEEFEIYPRHANHRDQWRTHMGAKVRKTLVSLILQANDCNDCHVGAGRSAHLRYSLKTKSWALTCS